MRWDRSDRARFATELSATGKAGGATVVDEAETGLCRVGLRLHARDEPHAVLFAMAAMSVAARRLGIVVEDVLAVRLRAAGSG